MAFENMGHEGYVKEAFSGLEEETQRTLLKDEPALANGRRRYFIGIINN